MLIVMMSLLDGFLKIGVNSDWAPEKTKVISSGITVTGWCDRRLYYTGDLI